MKKSIVILSFLIILSFSTVVGATLIDNGGGLIYDTDFNITWLQDANYAKTTNYSAADTNGRMTFTGANTWAANLVFGGASGWRLPTAFNQNGTGPDWGAYNVTGSELGHLWYTELNNTATALTNTGPFLNIPTSGMPLKHYLTSTVYAPLGGDWAYYFALHTGYSGVAYFGVGNDAYLAYAWAVHDGNVGSPVPLPGAVWLLGSGLLGLGGISRWRLRRS
jgi:hypothetical protein